ncbi:hypothetical protein A3F28_02410 [Candidatus Uhrbacteria bacterium RIFCSPHIGHO2_12_FULL_57_11]|uniref:Uncharacterized protein n=1 Tax=Candidatus Uhrbacteria bacterium RIFCSPHIGHO2_12_FULL_57_11 TaxID=1802398 RepID=A0A1F7UMR9_9BACT|nr:MAG: hypothetical protein A3F28_02410 [Candidatus Uhrbacteria bacterium RIFCSPHIGHO2_12_FULL_57_11]
MPRRKKIPHITAETFFQYVTCPSWVWYEVYGKKSEKKEPSGMMKFIMDEGVKHEKKVIADYKFEEVKLTDQDEAFLRTAELMKAGKNIYQGTLIDGRWAGRPDFLLRCEGNSKFGNYFYVPYDIKSSREIKTVQKFQLTFYALLLEKIQGVRPQKGHIINIDKQVLEFDIDDFLEEFHLTLAAIEKILAGEKPPPFLAGDCKKSPWGSKCVEEVVSCNDISLVYRLKRKEWEKFQEAGVKTITLLADMDFDEISDRLPGIRPGRLETIRSQAVALTRKEPIILEAAEFPEADEEIYFDIEGDPLLGVEYLFGCLVVSKPTTKRGKEKISYKKFLAANPKDEGQAWKQFIAFISKRKNAVVYHYGSYERTVIARMSARFPATARAGERLLEQMMDILRITSRSVAFPVYFYSLKDIARFLGFRWRHPESSGANSIVWYQDWLKGKDRAILKRIVDYNEDDVRATKVLKDWLAKNAGEK